MSPLTTLRPESPRAAGWRHPEKRGIMREEDVKVKESQGSPAKLKKIAK